MLANNLVVVPNAKLAEAIVVNHHLPSSDLTVLVEAGVDYASDPRQVELVVMEVGPEVMVQVPGGVPDFEPFIRCHTFADPSINFTAILRAKEVVDQYLIKHEFVKRLHARFNAEGIVIPFPIRTIAHKGEQTEGELSAAGGRLFAVTKPPELIECQIVAGAPDRRGGPHARHAVASSFGDGQPPPWSETSSGQTARAIRKRRDGASLQGCSERAGLTDSLRDQ